MKTFINSIAVIVFIIQFLSFILNAFCMQKAEDTLTILRNGFVFFSYFCSDIIVFVFILFYNFDFVFLKKKILNLIVFLVVIPAGYIHVWQIIRQRDFFLSSSILILFDIYIIYRISQNIILKRQ